MKGFPIPLRLALAILTTCHSSAFVPQPFALKHNCLSYEGRNNVNNNKLLAAETKDDDVNDNILLPSLQLPSPESVKENILEGEVGERGETYVVAQFSLLFFIAIGVGEYLVTTILGPVLIIAGLILVYKSAADLKDNLSPWPVATDPKAGRGSLIENGIYLYMVSEGGERVASIDLASIILLILIIIILSLANRSLCPMYTITNEKHSAIRCIRDCCWV